MPAPVNMDLDDGDTERFPGEVDPLSREEEIELENNLMGALWRTVSFRQFLEAQPPADIARRIGETIDWMANNQRLDIANLVDYLSWGLPETVTDRKLQSARTALMHCEMMPRILRTWFRPPRRHNKGIHTKAARDVIRELALQVVNELINTEMRNLAPVMRSPQDELSEESLLSIDLGDMISQAKTAAPTLWSILEGACSTPAQRERNTYKTHDARILQVVSIMSYSRSHHRCKLQKLMSIVLKAGGLSAKSNDTTHLWGLTMSQKWAYHGLDKLGVERRASMRRDILIYAFFGGHDNLNIRFRKFEQRMNNLTHFDSGTAATIYVIKDASVSMPDLDHYRMQRAIGAQNPITALDIFDADEAAASQRREQAIHLIKSFLIDSPAFDFVSYEHKDHDLFTHPTPVYQLPTGREHALCQYMLDTVHIEEASQDGNRQCLEEWLKQLHLSSSQASEREQAALKKLIIWVGDQLTVCRIRSLKKDRSWDFNFVQRFERFLELFGWFHAQLAEETSIHRQFYTTSKSTGLKHSADLLKRKGLHSPAVQGNFHHTMQEAIRHIASARFRDIWLVVGRAKDLVELRKRSPQEIHALAIQIHDEFASSLALTNLKARDRDDQDDVFINSVLFCRDVLNYLNLDGAMRTGDVGRMESLIPQLLFRFHGGGNSKYTIELLELMQGLKREWPPELRTYVLRYCWLGNTTGNCDGFAPFDLIQEHNIRDIKYIFAVHGPYATWEYIGNLSAAIPTLRRVKDHVESQFNHYRRGKSHSTPDEEKDIKQVQDSYRLSKIHFYQSKRHLSTVDCFKDFIAVGSEPQKLTSTIKRWAEKCVSEWETMELWDENVSEVETSNLDVAMYDSDV